MGTRYLSATVIAAIVAMATVTANAAPPQAAAAKPDVEDLRAVVEVFDAETGRTALRASDCCECDRQANRKAHRQANRKAHRAAVRLGIARGQIARLSALNTAAAETLPITVELVFMDAMGAEIARDLKTIAPGQATFVDISFDAVSHGEGRLELSAVVNVLDVLDLSR